MCGLCGWIGVQATPEDEIVATRMRDTLAHRGPDGAGGLGLQSDDGAIQGWMGHRRLKVLDVTHASDQPMVGSNSRVALTFNGEIYNFRELRQELKALGHHFQSTGDTEVVLRAYEEWGAASIARLDGMFALAIWDGRRGELLLARDRSGKKPLYYSEQLGRLTFGSEIKALLACPWVDNAPDLSRTAEFFTFGYVPSPRTFYRSISQVPPASVLTYKRNGVCEVKPYWELPRVSDDAVRRPDLDKIATLLKAATARRLVSDVPVGALLSGGIDSSLVVALMSQVSEEPVRTFAAGFSGGDGFDERPYARLVAQRFGTHHTELEVEPDAVAVLDRLLWHHDQPFGDSSAIATYLICEAARAHVTVVLNGDGGDEVFGGYERFTAVRIAQALPQAFAKLTGLVGRGLSGDGSYNSVAKRLNRFAAESSLPITDRYLGWISIVNRDLLASLLVDSTDHALSSTNSFSTSCAQAGNVSNIDKVIYANFLTYLPDDLAVKMDRTSMAHSLETRSPFLDTALIEYMALVSGNKKVGLRQVKPLLYKSMKPLLPQTIWKRRKHGFGVPVGEWLRSGELRTLFEDEVLVRDARSLELVDQSTIREMWQAHQQQEVDHSACFWSLLTFERWLRSRPDTESVRKAEMAVAAI